MSCVEALNSLPLGPTASSTDSAVHKVSSLAPGTVLVGRSRRARRSALGAVSKLTMQLLRSLNLPAEEALPSGLGELQEQVMGFCFLARIG